LAVGAKLTGAKRKRREIEMQDMVHPAIQEHGRRLEVDARDPAGSRRRGAVCIRAVSSGDEEGLRGMLSRLSKKTIYQRFHMPYPRVPE